MIQDTILILNHLKGVQAKKVFQPLIQKNLGQATETFNTKTRAFKRAL